ncbi:hypothetical protein RA2_02222 [Roseovarius sp. A-2]|nr:hypothetical protein RA2_02222 [Roseovarius sp. A-2]
MTSARLTFSFPKGENTPSDRSSRRERAAHGRFRNRSGRRRVGRPTSSALANATNTMKSSKPVAGGPIWNCSGAVGAKTERSGAIRPMPITNRPGRPTGTIPAWRPNSAARTAVGQLKRAFRDSSRPAGADQSRRAPRDISAIQLPRRGDLPRTVSDGQAALPARCRAHGGPQSRARHRDHAGLRDRGVRAPKRCPHSMVAQVMSTSSMAKVRSLPASGWFASRITCSSVTSTTVTGITCPCGVCT